MRRKRENRAIYDYYIDKQGKERIIREGTETCHFYRKFHGDPPTLNIDKADYMREYRNQTNRDNTPAVHPLNHQ